MKAFLLAGGFGTRMREETEFRPKPMVEVGGRPVLWHLMKFLNSYQINDFVVAVGYKSEQIKDYFLNYEARNNDFTVKFGPQQSIAYHGQHQESEWSVTVTDTGTDTMTGGRLFAARRYLEGAPFLATYGDGLSNVDVGELISFHRRHGRIATVTTVRPLSRFGVLDIDGEGQVTSFREKPQVDGWINVGYFVFEPEIFEYLEADSVLEQEPLVRLAADGQLMAYRHGGFWQPMDTYRESQILNQLWEEGRAPWRTW
jgi:glucose-1-phosphate cytidylyltransferase